MATTTNIPLTTLPVGSRTFGPHIPKNAELFVSFTIDRTVTGGLNSLTVDSQLAMIAEMSTDGGSTWHATDTDQPGSQTSWSTVGGPDPKDRNGNPPLTSGAMNWPLFPGTNRRVRATVTVTGPSPIAVAGNITTS